MSRLIVRARAGSHLHGTTTPDSDVDHQEVRVPDPVDILLQRAEGGKRTTTRPGDVAKNRPEDKDEQIHSLHQFMRLVAQGQTTAIDLLFSPSWAWEQEPHPVWHDLLEYRSRMLSKNVVPMLEYCRKQAHQYGLKGTRAGALKRLVATLESLPPGDSIERHLDAVSAVVDDVEGITFDRRPTGGGKELLLISAGGKSCLTHIPIRKVAPVFRRQLEKYGPRAHAAETNQGVDWKAVAHAVRVGWQTIELLRDGFITFPRPEADHLLRIKTGQVPYKEVAEEIEHLMAEVPLEAARSSLPTEPDRRIMDLIVAKAYRDEVARVTTNDIAYRIVELHPPSAIDPS